ncbi:hypothetical protein AB6D66_01555 [Vibrio pomeroyi]|uniref:Uncharacterized protein n=1 Tax=Vibrio pomeroyi TaxID=198832 RepID=A0ABV4MRF9_9VIBR|nr:hypothetical protein [Vibrio atlanticus]MCZ4310190.1 hypothetical protein [Vibrio atlanticus]
MTIRTSKTPRLRGNTPTAILGWFRELSNLNASFHPDDDPADLHLFTEQGLAFIKEDMAYARTLCKNYRVCIYTIGMVADKSKPLIAIHCLRDGYGYSVISEKGEEMNSVSGFKDKDDVYTELNLEFGYEIEDYFIADACYVGVWFANLTVQQRLPVIEQTVIGDFGPVYCKHLDDSEEARIERSHEACNESGESDDIFSDLLSGMAIHDPYNCCTGVGTVAPATEYGYSYVQWYKQGSSKVM